MNNNLATTFKEVLLRTMKAFDMFCQQYNIKYMAAYGTVIGAIRHKGLIPWDDDIDVFMDWENYNKFLSLREEARAIGNLIVDRRDYGYYLPMAKFVDTQTTVWELKKYPFTYGVYIDIFPLGYANDINSAKQMHESYVYHSIQLTKAYARYSFSYADIRHFIGHPFEVVKEYLARTSIDKEMKALDELDEKIYEIKDGKYRIYYRSMDRFERSLFKSEWFSDIIRVPFEDFEISVPSGYHDYLTTVYGDYMTPPPPCKQVSHHSHYYLNLKECLSIDEIKKRIRKGEKIVY